MRLVSKGLFQFVWVMLEKYRNLRILMKTLALSKPLRLKKRRYKSQIFTSSDALPLSYRRTHGSWAIDIASCEKHRAYYYDLNVHEWYMWKKCDAVCFFFSFSFFHSICSYPLTPRTFYAIFSIFSVSSLSITFNSHWISKILYPTWRRKANFTSLRSDNLSRIYFNVLDAIKDNFVL